MPHIILYSLLCILLIAVPCHAADVLIIADAQLKPVMEVTQGMRKTLRASTKTYSPEEVRGNLAAVLQREGARVVVALGREALAEALTLPPSIPVIYDMVVTPSAISRPNTAGFYMATPAVEYAELVRNHLPALKRVAVVASRDFLNMLASNVSAPMIFHSVKNTVEFVNTVNQLENADAILLLPDRAVMSTTAMEEAYLLSFRRRIPLLGFSERHVKEGALLALVVDMANVGRVIGEYATKALKSGNVGQHAPLAPNKFELYLNLDTARKMRISIPDEVVRMARKAYP
ncbi:MAG: ABC transporter substrate binding protein [Desulfuromonadaceae bacterium]|nr:ABC transporter substrate binding protein [Desulfuromonadaceae bacterium]